VQGYICCQQTGPLGNLLVDEPPAKDLTSNSFAGLLLQFKRISKSGLFQSSSNGRENGSSKPGIEVAVLDSLHSLTSKAELDGQMKSK